MYSGPFGRTLELVNASETWRTILIVGLMTASVCVLDGILYGRDFVNTTGLTVLLGLSVVVMFVRRFAKSHGPRFAIRDLYILRCAGFAAWTGMVTLFFAILQHDVARLDKRFALTSDEVLGGFAIAGVASAAAFLLFDAKRIWAFWKRASRWSRNAQVSLAELDETYGLTLQRRVAPSASTGAAIFGAVVLRQLPWSNLIVFSLALFVGTFILRGAICLLFEVTFLLLPGSKRGLILVETSQSVVVPER